MLDGLTLFDGHLLCLLSDDDLTAHEFANVVRGGPGWKRIGAHGSAQRVWIKDADHTLTRRQNRDRARELILDWLAASFGRQI